MAEDRKRQLQAGSVKPHHPLMEIVASRLLGIEGVPLAEQKRMVNRAARDAVQWHEAEVERLRKALHRIGAMAGNPEAADACRLIIREVKAEMEKGNG